MTMPIFLHTATARCAARFIWFIGTCQAVFCGFLFWLVLSGGQFGVFGLVRVPAGGFSDLNGVWQLATDTYAASVMTLAIFGTVLAVTQMLLGFAIHARRRWSATVALVFTLAQCLAVALLLAMAHVIQREGLANNDFIETRTKGIQDLLNHIEDFTPEWAATITGLNPKDIETAAILYASANRSAIYYTLGITEHICGVDNVQSLSN